jgi:hypothetical protein
MLPTAATILLLPTLSTSACGSSEPHPQTPTQGLPASGIEWQGLLGKRGEDRIYFLAGQGFMGIPFLASPDLDDGLDAFVRTWLQEHPEAVVVPVESYPFLTESAHLVYAWIRDGEAHLNIDLVELGYCRAGIMVPLLRAEDRLVDSREVDEFLERIVAAETRAAAARLGIWESASPEKYAGAGSIPPSGSMVLADLIEEAKAADAAKPPPPPDYDARSGEDELIRIAEGDDPTASYAAAEELVRRALDDALTAEAFRNLIARALERQARTELDWRGHDAALLQIAHSRGMLSEADLESYAAHFLHLRVSARHHDMSAWPEERRLPPVRLEVVVDPRGSFVDEIQGETVPAISMFAIVRLRGIELDGAPVAMIRAGGAPQAEVVFHHDALSGGTIGLGMLLSTEDPIASGTHLLTGHADIVVKRGAHSWRDGANEAAPVILQRQEQFRATFEVPAR